MLLRQSLWWQPEEDSQSTEKQEKSDDNDDDNETKSKPSPNMQHSCLFGSNDISVAEYCKVLSLPLPSNVFDEVDDGKHESISIESIVLNVIFMWF